MPAAVNGMKECSKCHEIKPVVEFGKNRSRKDGLSYYCKKCHRKRVIEWESKNKDKMEKYHIEYNEQYKKNGGYKKYYQSHKEEMKKYEREYREKNIEKIKKRVRALAYSKQIGIERKEIPDFLLEIKIQELDAKRAIKPLLED